MGIGFLISIFARWGVAEKFQRPLAWFSALALVLVLLSLGKCAYDGKLIADHDAKREAKASAAREGAAEEAARDAIINTRHEEDLHAAINSVPRSPLAGDGRITPAAHALACERLRKIGRIPEACRPESGNRGQAGAD